MKKGKVKVLAGSSEAWLNLSECLKRSSSSPEKPLACRCEAFLLTFHPFVHFLGFPGDELGSWDTSRWNFHFQMRKESDEPLLLSCALTKTSSFDVFGSDVLWTLGGSESLERKDSVQFKLKLWPELGVETRLSRTWTFGRSFGTSGPQCCQQSHPFSQQSGTAVS